jgi:phosphatidate phosphatase PAH1
VLRPFLFLAILALPGCEAGLPPCEPHDAIVTDIDETLTTSDTEWLAQLMDPTHDPEMRPDASELMRGYDDLGYTVYYITARGESLDLSDGTTARDATRAWLEVHGFPVRDGTLFLAPGNGALGDAAVEYKTETIEELELAGWPVHWAYGNSDTDIEAFQLAGIPDDRIFAVGEDWDELDGLDIPDEDAFVVHAQEHLPTVVEAECE